MAQLFIQISNYRDLSTRSKPRYLLFSFRAGLQKIFTSAKELNKNMNRSAEITFNFKELVYKNYLEHKSVLFMLMLYLFLKITYIDV